MMLYFVLKYLHVVGAGVLLGTGSGIAFFMLAAHLGGKPSVIAGVARIVVTRTLSSQPLPWLHSPSQVRCLCSRRLLLLGRMDRLVDGAVCHHGGTVAARRLDANAPEGSCLNRSGKRLAFAS
jgi:Predicted integral membrane protein (DUF2269)